MIMYHTIYYSIVPPTVPQVTGSFAVMEQDTLQLQCTSSGYPLPMITWVKRSGEVASILVNNLRVSIATENFDSNSTTASTLQIHNTINEDRGNYQCEASNAAGTNTAVQTIGIVGKLKTAFQLTQGFILQKETTVKHNHARMVEHVWI